MVLELLLVLLGCSAQLCSHPSPASHPSPCSPPIMGMVGVPEQIRYQRGEDEVVVLRHHSHCHGLGERRERRLVRDRRG